MSTSSHTRDNASAIRGGQNSCKPDANTPHFGEPSISESRTSPLPANNEGASAKTPFGSYGSNDISVQIKGRPGSLELILDPDAPLITILEELRQLLLANSELIKHAPKVRLNFNNREIDKLQYSEICRLLESHRLIVTQITLNPEALLCYLEGEFGVPVDLQLANPSASTSMPEMRTAANTPDLTSTPHPSALELLRGLNHEPHSESLDTPSRPHPAPPNVANPNAATANFAPASPASLRSPTSTSSKIFSPSEVNPTSSPSSFASASQVSLRTPTGTSSKIFSSLASSDAASAPSNLNGLSTPTGEVVKYPDAPLGSLPPLDFIPVQSPNSPSASFATSEANHDSFSAEVGQSLSSGQRTLHKVMRTCRAGTALQFEGDVIVFGDLNAGAEIKATGDIIVLGSLRGLAHAGHLGETQAKIYATDLSPTQLRLADQIAIPPAGDNARPRTKMSFEIAFLNEDKKIEVKSFTIGRPTK